ncbi:MAG TPA: hypothetical protein PLE35_04655, partial [Lentisphaeria bacterium]|nr:hypothetical protein [Lentisphaeria bacterium]
MTTNIHLNIFHRTAVDVIAGEDCYDIFRRQQDLAHDLGMKTTVFVKYSDLFDDRILADVTAYRERWGDEIGLSLHDLNGPDTCELSGGMQSIWLFSKP